MERKIERLQFRKSMFTHLPCATYGDDARAEFTMGGSEAVMSEWFHCCKECAVNLVLSAFDIPELAEAITPLLAAKLEAEQPTADDAASTREQAETAAETVEAKPQIEAALEGGETTITQPEDPLACPHCDFVAKTSLGLGSHVRSKHPDCSATSEV